jgi:hypothetical protein
MRVKEMPAKCLLSARVLFENYNLGTRSRLLSDARVIRPVDCEASAAARCDVQ